MYKNHEYPPTHMHNGIMVLCIEFEEEKGLIQWVGDFDIMTQTMFAQIHSYPPTCITVSWYYAFHMKKNVLIQWVGDRVICKAFKPNYTITIHRYHVII